MVGFRITGIVRSACWAQETLRRGLPDDERPAFLAHVADSVAQIEGLCADEGVSPDVLPAPSRRALADLRAIARLAMDDLPAPLPEAPERRHIKISNVVWGRDRLLARLETAAPGSTDLERALLEARRHVDRVDAILRSAKATPAALPRPTGMAYALLAWLLQDDHADLYVSQRDLVLAFLTPALIASGLLPPPRSTAEGSTARASNVAVRFLPGRRIYTRKPRAGGAVQCVLNVGWIAADEDALQDLAWVVADKESAPPKVLERFSAFFDSEDCASMRHAVRAAYASGDDRVRGRAYDLDALFHRVNARYFDGTMTPPRLTWYTSLGYRRFGFYTASLDCVHVDDRLDDPAIPESVTEFVLYHELLHRKHGVERRGRRRHVHTPAFRKDERLHPSMDEADRWMTALIARGESGERGKLDMSDAERETSGEPTAVQTPGVPPARRTLPRRPAPREVPRHTQRETPQAMLPTASRERPGEPLRSTKVPRNAPCPCGSGKKSKRCCAGKGTMGA